MRLDPSPLERWFTTHPGPHAHGLAGTQAGALAFEQLPLQADWATSLDLGYGEPEGDPELRDRVAETLGLPGREHVLLTHGAVEANWLGLAALVRAGDRVVVQTPIYPQLPCVASGLGGEVVAWHLPADPDHPPDLATLAALLPGARLLVLNSPHNPTGRVFSRSELTELLRLAREAGCYVLSDEVYRGVGSGPVSPSALAARGVLVTGSLSKAPALPGLRLGWLAGDAALIQAAVPWREHTTLAIAGPAIALAKALWPHLSHLTADNQALLDRNRATLQAWVDARPGWSGRASRASGAMLVRPPVDADGLAEAWYREDRGMVLPASVCGFDGQLRLGFGHRDPQALVAALESLAARAERL